jgi:hypothetical protein
LFLTPHWEGFDVFHNKAVAGEPQNFSFAVGNVSVYGRELSPLDRANMLLYQEQKRSDSQMKLILYEARSFARSAPGEMDLKIEGVVRHGTAQEILPNAFPA